MRTPRTGIETCSSLRHIHEGIHAYNLQEKFLKRCRRVNQEISEESMEIEGEFLTLADMHERKFAPYLICTHTTS